MNELLVRRHARNTRVFEAVVVALVPVLQLLQSLFALSLLPAFWRFYADPPYMYLFNSLSLATGLTPQHVDHPGTSLQWLMAGIEHTTFALSGTRQSLADDIVWNPEKYLTISGVTLAALFAASVAFFLWRVLSSIGFIPAISAGLLILSASGLTVPWIVTATPEALVVACVMLILGILTPTLVDRNVQPSRAQLLMIGVLLAIGVTAKVIILPLLVLFLFVLRLRGLLITAVTSLIAALLILIPVYELLPRMFGWFTNLARSSGRYGGDSQTAVTSNIRIGLSTVTNEYPLTWIVIAVFLVALIASTRQGPNTSPSTYRFACLGIALSIAAVLGVSFKETTDRDFILLVGLVPLLAALVIAWIHEMRVFDGLVGRRTLVAVVYSGLAGLVVAAMLQNIRSFRELNEIQVMSDREVALMEQASQREGVVAHSFLAQNEFFTLMLGSEWAYHPYSDKIIDRFPDNLYYNAFLSTLFGPRSDGGIGYLDCTDLSPVIQQRGLTFVLPGDYSEEADREVPGQIALSNGSVLIFDPEAVLLVGNRLSTIPIESCVA